MRASRARAFRSTPGRMATAKTQFKAAETFGPVARRAMTSVDASTQNHLLAAAMIPWRSIR
jgi:hypothetical protein